MPDARLPFEADAIDPDSRIDARDRDGRARAVDPRFNVALEASAGTGKTRILVDRYVNLLRAGVDPSNILAMTFTRKAAAEMRERILATLRSAAERGEIPRARWRELRDRTGDIEISTIDAFCLSLLREFPLEADLDPGFMVADDTEVPRLVDEALDRALGICRGLAREDEHVALVLAQLGDRRLRAGLAALLSRRIVAPRLLGRLLGRARPDLTVATVVARAADAVLEMFASMIRGSRDYEGAWSDGLRSFVTTGPADSAFMILVSHLEALASVRHSGLQPDPAAVRAALERLSGYFLTSQGEPRKRLSHAKAVFPSPLHWKRHRDLVVACAPQMAGVLTAYRADVNALLARGVWRIFRIAEAEYRRTLDAHGVLDFSDLLLRTRQLLGQMEEFARSRYKLESRYHHVLVDEFQDTSRAQWELVLLLVQSWGEGAGLADAAPLPPSIFIVGDSKQSIYSFRDADVSVLADAARALEGLRPDGDVRRSISRSFRSVPALLSFVNDVCHDLDKAQGRADAFRYDERDSFPVGASTVGHTDELGAIVAEGPQLAAEAVADEVQRLIAVGTVVRDVASGVPRPAVASDIAILFRTRESHRVMEEALARRHVPAYVYKGLGFFDTSEIRDVLATLWHLAEPCSNLRAAAWLRSGVVRLSDEGLRRLGPGLADALTSPTLTSAAQSLDDADARTLATAREASARWRGQVDRITPSELVDLVLSDAAYSIEMRGYRFRQARENLKKIRSLVRRIQSKGSATLTRIVSHLDRLALGDESNAPIDARGAVNLMTVHAAKGLEFPIVFVVNLTTGTGGRRPAIHLMDRSDGQASISIGDFDSTMDEDDSAREREDTKRLLYVALTRARDRLYLSAFTRNGRLHPGRGSLADVLPASLLDALGQARHETFIRWQASTGAIHAFRACTGPEVQALENLQSETEGPVEGLHTDESDFLPLEAPGKRDRFRGDSPDAWVGRKLVHRLVEQLGLPRRETGERSLAEHVERLLEPDERELVVAPAQLVRDVCSTYEALAGRSDLAALFQDGEAFFEVPVSFVVDGVPDTALVGCLIRTRREDASGQAGERLTILEFRTSPPRPEDREEVLPLCRAVSDAFPGGVVSASLVYGSSLVPV